MDEYIRDRKFWHCNRDVIIMPRVICRFDRTLIYGDDINSR